MRAKTIFVVCSCLLLFVVAEAGRDRLPIRGLRAEASSLQATLTRPAAGASPAAARSAAVPAQQPAAAAAAATCSTLDGNKLPNGRLCTTQLVTTERTVVTCADYSAACLKKETTQTLLVPKGNAGSNPGDYNLSADAACKLLGYATSGGGSIHITGDDEHAKATCFTGKGWDTANYWTVLVCCK